MTGGLFSASFRWWVRNPVAAIAVPVLLSCGGGDGGPTAAGDRPQPGTLEIVLTTPYSDDGAILVMGTGPAPARVRPRSPVGSLRVESTGNAFPMEIALFGNIASGSILEFSVEDVNQVDEYQFVISEVAARDGRLRDDLGDYQIEVVR